MPTRYTNLPDNKNKIYGGAYSVHDQELCAYRDLIINNFTLKNKKLFLKKRGHNSKEFEKIYSKLFNQIKNNSK